MLPGLKGRELFGEFVYINFPKEKSTNKDLSKAGERIKALNDAAAEIALILVRATYFTIETKSEFGTERATKATEEIMKDLNKILPMVITDPQKRAEWIVNLQNTLPKRE